MTRERTFVIAGAGLAGAKAAETLRSEGFDGRVVLIGTEPERPYERPPLSKDYLRGEAVRDRLYVHSAGFYERHDIELRTAATVTGLDASAQTVTLGDGELLGYDQLLLATGAGARRLPVAGGDLDGVLYLRSVADCDALRGRLSTSASVVIAGAGWIGCEVAASARQLGLDVTVIEPATVPLERALGERIGAMYLDLHAGHGVRMLMGTGVTAFEGTDAVERVLTADGRTVDCDLVVVGAGAQPNVALAAQARLRIDDGILVDEHLRTSASGIFAAGDVAKAYSPSRAQWIRVEHWANALNQGRAAARSMLGHPEQPYDRVPYFYSDQYDVAMEYSGFAHGFDRMVLRGDPASHELVAFWLAGDRVVAGMGVNTWSATEPIRALIREQTPVDDAALEDPDVPLEDLAPVASGWAA